VRNVKNAHAIADGVVFGIDAFVLYGHVVASKRYHFGAEFAVLVAEGCVFHVIL
jgi:hypothetical protein